MRRAAQVTPAAAAILAAILVGCGSNGDPSADSSQPSAKITRISWEWSSDNRVAVFVTAQNTGHVYIPSLWVTVQLETPSGQNIGDILGQCEAFIQRVSPGQVAEATCEPILPRYARPGPAITSLNDPRLCLDGISLSECQRLFGVMRVKVVSAKWIGCAPESEGGRCLDGPAEINQLVGDESRPGS
jgi:hypothetical protein